MVRHLCDALSMHGVNCWPDRILTPGTHQWRANVRQAIARASCVVLALSQDTSWSAWVEIALEHAAEFKVPVIPVLVQGDPGHLMLVQLAGQEWFDLRYRKRYAQEVTELVTLIRACATQRVVEAV